MDSQKVYTFSCPVCDRIERTEAPGEPMCTGPRWTDDHDLTVMKLQTTRSRNTNDEFISAEDAEARRTGALLMPGHKTDKHGRLATLWTPKEGPAAIGGKAPTP